MADPFDVLGIEPKFVLDLKATEARYRELSRLVHPDRYKQKGRAERRQALGRAIDLNDAWRALRSPISRGASLLRRAGVSDERAREAKADPMFLMDMMETREALADAIAERALPAIDKVEAQTRAAWDGSEGEFAAAAADLPGAAAEATALASLGKMRYLRRILDEIDEFRAELEDELD